MCSDSQRLDSYITSILSVEFDLYLWGIAT